MKENTIVLLVVILFLTSCNLQEPRRSVSDNDLINSTIQPSETLNIEDKPLPPFLGFVYPEPGSNESVDVYEAAKLIGSDTKPGVCVSFHTYHLLEPGDDLSVSEAVSRLSLKIDGRYVTEMYVTLLTDDYPLLPLDPETGEPLAQFEGGTNIRGCFEVVLREGLHSATFVARKTSGEELHYTWSFVLTEPVP